MKTPILIMQGSKQPYLSVGIYFGGINAFGKEYYYDPKNDAFIRKDYVKKIREYKTFSEFVEFVKNVEKK